MSDVYTTRNTCRGCGTVLDGSLLNLGLIALNDFPTTPIPREQLPHAPLDVVHCPGCSLVQLRHTVRPDLMYRDQYWYHSGVNEAMRAELHDIVDAARTLHGLYHFVVDIGANDGTLLSNYSTADMRVAVEPCLKFRDGLFRHADAVISDYFPGARGDYRSLKGKADIVTAIACCYDLEDPLSFFEGIRDLLAPDGIAVIQFQDLLQMVELTAFDNVCHEHLEYYSLTSLIPILARAGLVCVEVEHRAINGGSLRCYLQHARGRNWAQFPLVVAQVEQERRRLTPVKLQDFVWRVSEARKHLQAIVSHAAQQGPVDLYGASTKFNTLAQACGLDHTLIRQAVERSPEKWGRYTVATNIPIVSEEAWRENPAPFTVCGIWQFRESVLAREEGYLQKGGIFFFPLPCADLVTQGGC